MASYTTLTADDMLAIARDTLRATETDHLRITLMAQNQVDQDRIRFLADKMVSLRAEIGKLEGAAKPADEPAKPTEGAKP